LIEFRAELKRTGLNPWINPRLQGPPAKLTHLTSWAIVHLLPRGAGGIQATGTIETEVTTVTPGEAPAHDRLTTVTIRDRTTEIIRDRTIEIIHDRMTGIIRDRTTVATHSAAG